MAGTVKQLRLTFKNPDGTWGVSGMNEKNQDEKVYGCLFKLKDYEDTGLDPEQLEEIDKLYLKKCQEVNRLREELSKRQIVRTAEEIVKYRCNGCSEYANCYDYSRPLCEYAQEMHDWITGKEV